MGSFILRRTGVMLLTAICLTFIVFFMTNLYPNLEKLAKSEGNMRMSDEQVQSWLVTNGYQQNVFKKYGEWLGVVPSLKTVVEDKTYSRCARPGMADEDITNFCGVLQGNFGFSSVYKGEVSEIIGRRLGLTAWLMLWTLVIMIPSALIIGIMAGMREGSRQDRTLSTLSIITTATPEYVSGVLFVIFFASSRSGISPWLKEWGLIDGRTLLKGVAKSAVDDMTFDNFTLPVLTIAIYGIGYIARMTRASMAEVMTAQYIRTARLKGVSFRNIVLKHALRNALIAPFTVIMLQIPWLLTGVVIVESLFSYPGFGLALVEAAGNNDIQLLLGISVVAVLVVLSTQLISDIGYVFLNPRIRVS
jgi:peptide/nickel transport system permease protein